jgi:hypothetical protein
MGHLPNLGDKKYGLMIQQSGEQRTAAKMDQAHQP